jgi:hypothetical protein
MGQKVIVAAALGLGLLSISQQARAADAAIATLPTMGSESARGLNGLELGARLGFGLPLGSTDGAAGNDFSKYFSNSTPIWLDAGYRFNRRWYGGLYFMYGVGSIASDLGNSFHCNDSGVGCWIHDTRVGANAHYHFMPGAGFDPWLGAGLGYEWAALDVSAGNSGAGVGRSGWEFLNVQAGLDYKGARSFVVGPFVTLTLTQFDTAWTTGEKGSSSSNSINNKALHEWLTLGVRGAFDLKVM